MTKNNSKNNVVLFRGAKLSTREANKVGLALIMAGIGLLFSLVVFGIAQKALAGVIAIVFSAVAYFVVGNKVFK